MKKLMVVAIIVLVVCFSAFAWADPMSEGRGFMATGEMWEEAVKQFEQVIKTEPTNAEAHYLLAICYLRLNNQTGARKRLSSAANLDKSYRPKVADIYEQAAWVDFGSWEARTISVQEKIELAISYDPPRRMVIVKKLEAKGKDTKSITALDYAIKLNNGTDPGFAHRVADFWQVLSEREPLEELRITYRKKAADLWPEKYYEAMVSEAEMNAKKNLDAAKLQARIPDKSGSNFHEDETNRLKALAILYYTAAGKNGQAIVEGEVVNGVFVYGELPEVRTYNSSSEWRMFKLHAGEQLDHWAKMSSFHVDYGYEDGCKFDILHLDDHVQQMVGDRRSMNTTIIIKLRAITDCTQLSGGAGFKVN